MSIDDVPIPREPGRSRGVDVPGFASLGPSGSGFRERLDARTDRQSQDRHAAALNLMAHSLESLGDRLDARDARDAELIARMEALTAAVDRLTAAIDRGEPR